MKKTQQQYIQLKMVRFVGENDIQQQKTYSARYNIDAPNSYSPSCPVMRICNCRVDGSAMTATHEDNEPQYVELF